MAQTIMCSNDDGNPAAILITNLENGDALSPCAACWTDFVDAMHAAAHEGEQAPADVAGPDDDEPDDADESPALSPAEALALPADVEPEVASLPNRAARPARARRARAGGGS